MIIGIKKKHAPTNERVKISTHPSGFESHWERGEKGGGGAMRPLGVMIKHDRTPPHTHTHTNKTTYFLPSESQKSRAEALAVSLAL